MRVSLEGYAGVRPPVPGGAPPTGGGIGPVPIPTSPLVVAFEDGDIFHKSEYLAMGYNRFDVMCIGAAGGRGGGWTQHHNGGLIYNYGGAGGGGGLHRVRGKLSLLPSSVAVVVGAFGGDQTSIVDVGDRGQDTSRPAGILDGGDGGFSSFGTTTCRASGGKGGKAAPSLGHSLNGGADGGEGGIGNAVGSGGAVNVIDYHDIGTPQQPGIHLDGMHGPWNGIIGSGGHGGSAGWMKSISSDPFNNADYWTIDEFIGDEGEAYQHASDGGNGSYSATDPSVSGPGGESLPQTIAYLGGLSPTTRESRSKLFDLMPGSGGGATIFPLDGTTLQYGSRVGGRDGAGAVVVKLTHV